MWTWWWSCSQLFVPMQHAPSYLNGERVNITPQDLSKKPHMRHFRHPQEKRSRWSSTPLQKAYCPYRWDHHWVDVAKLKQGFLETILWILFVPNSHQFLDGQRCKYFSLSKWTPDKPLRPGLRPRTSPPGSSRKWCNSSVSDSWVMFRACSSFKESAV